MARTFGASQEQAALTRLITGTLPIGLAESTVTQADLILAFFLLCTAEWLLAWRKSGRLHDSALMSIAAGLALATKNTGYLIELPFGLWFLAAVLQKERRRILSILICAVLVLLPNAPTYLRNSAYGGSLLGHTGFVNATTDWGLGPFVLNAVRNAAVHFATPVDRVNRLLTAALVHGLAFVGLDANDPNVTYDLGGAGQPFGLSTIRTGDETAPNPIHVLLCVTATIFFLLGRNSSETAPRYYAMCVTAAVGVFLILLKWNPWATRWHLPLFALAIPLVGTMPNFRMGSKTRTGLAAALILLALPVLFANRTRPLFPVPRAWTGFPVQFWSTAEEKVFASAPGKLPQFQSVIDYALRHHISQIGLILNYDDWEYPYWRYFREAGVKSFRIEHVGLSEHAFGVPYPLGPFSPEAIISVGQSLPSEFALDHQSFRKELESSNTMLYLEQH